MDRSWVQNLGGVSFYVHPRAVGTLIGSQGRETPGFTPVTVLSSRYDSISELDNVLEEFATADDVYGAAPMEFRRTLVVSSADEIPHTSSSRETRVYPDTCYSTETVIATGPYFLLGNHLHQVWRLYEDHLDAFMITTIPEDPTSPQKYVPLPAASSAGVWKCVAVPSRLYARGSHKPLAGVRVAVKDCFNLAGIQTTMMSRQYMELNGPVKENADYVETLIRSGAIIVGKTKMNAFASSDEPTDQYIDSHCPFNPRGDMYQSPSGSSAGAAAALAGYAWLDFSVGADTAGSIRAPATANGLFSLRTSFGSTSMEGIMPNCRAFDVVGLLGRDIASIQKVLRNTHDFDDLRKFPTKIIYPKEFFPHSNPTHQDMVEKYIRVIETALGIQRTEISLIERWDQNSPREAGGKPLMEYMAGSAFKLQCFDFNQIFKPYRDQYRERFGKEVFAGAVNKYRWSTGEAVTTEMAAKCRKEIEVFRKWCKSDIFDGQEDSIMILPYGTADPKYRDQPNDPPSGSHSIGEKFMSPILEMPQLVLPIGQMPYQSRITKRLEYRPITGTMVGAHGSDMMLLKLAQQAFDEAGWPTEVMTGRHMFAVGHNINRNVATCCDQKVRGMRSNGDDNDDYDDKAALSENGWKCVVI